MVCRCLAQTSKNPMARSMAPAFLQRFTGGNQTPLQALRRPLRRRCDCMHLFSDVVFCFCGFCPMISEYFGITWKNLFFGF